VLIDNDEKYLAMLDRLRTGPPLMVYDLETSGLDPFRGDRLIGVAILIPDMSGETPGETFYIPFRHLAGTNLPIDRLYWLAPFLADPQRSLVGFNLKFDVHSTEIERIPVFNRHMDVMLAAHLANENELSFALKHLGTKYLESSAADAESELMQKIKKRVKELGGSTASAKLKGEMRVLPPEHVAPYAEQDVYLTWQLARFYQEVLTKQGLLHLWPEVNAYSETITAMERRGVLIDPERCKRNLEYAKQRQEELYSQMRQIVGKDFNPNSVPQLREILKQKKTDRDTLIKLAQLKNPIAPLLLEYRAWVKVAGTYYEEFLKLMDDSYRIHPNLNLIGTISSRLSCSRPNLQALPRGTDVYRVRDLVIAPPGYVLVSFDWNQAELRLLAHYTKDEFLLDAYRHQKDIHQETADRIGITRTQAKRTNFSIVYGVGKIGLAEELGISVPEAAQLLERYHAMLPGIRKLYSTSEQIATRNRQIPMWTGRLRHYREEDPTHRAMSHLIQGGVAEMARIALTKLHRRLEGTRAYQILQVHDEILFEIPIGQEIETVKAIKAIMEDYPFDVPIVAEGKIGYSWGNMKPIDFRDGEPVIPKLERENV
jgi:DNA polymerase-1